ncbi:MAG: biosynthetic arginine decarboxylase [Verrucomicrobiae bacterium]|nr:biosynthetic arginine decarboxylase [Verrucomicrobiae bacterium]
MSFVSTPQHFNASTSPSEHPEAPSDAAASYYINEWSEGYATINEKGNVAILPTREKEKAIDLMDVVQEGKKRGFRAPLLIRFQDLLRDRVRRLNESFATSIEEAGYKNCYRGVFPIKVNQLHEVVEEIVDAGKKYHFGLEAGSKPEMIAALSVHEDPESLLVGNGYKDPELIQAALMGVKLGKKVILVVEKLEELYQILAVAKRMNVVPLIGARVRLLSKGAGKWATSGGENAKFGLDTAELVTMSDVLHEAGIPQALKMLHYHVGSQVPDISTINRATSEATRFYAKLYQMGHSLEYLDVGGGLAVDYDGSRTSFDSSMNYSVHEYTRTLVYNIMEICDAEKVPHPIIVSESGRYIAAPHSVLIVEAFGVIEKEHAPREIVAAPSDHKLVNDMFEIGASLTKKRRQENLHDAQQIRDQAQSMFELGILDLRSKAKIDALYWQIAAGVVQLYKDVKYVPEEVKELEVSLADQLICNFSVFQSIIDHWALGQLFPIMPIHRHHEKMERQGTLVDITCDSDGKIAKFIDFQDVRPTLPLHRLIPNEPYYLGFFLTGAYQDIMGDLHNLFGRVNEMHVFLDEDEEEGYYIEEEIPGTTVGSVLTHTQWDPKEMARRIKTQLDAAIKSDRLKPNEGMRLLSEYERTLNSYTYLNFS